jgi:hypothetical protein
MFRNLPASTLGRKYVGSMADAVGGRDPAEEIAYSLDGVRDIGKELLQCFRRGFQEW